MDKIRMQIEIDASREKVWSVLWDDKSYRDWTSVFSPGSHAVSDWKEGSLIRFLNGKGEGMFSEIEELKPHIVMTFKHIGEIHENLEGKPAAWAGAREKYILEDKGGKTLLTVELDASGSDMDDYFRNTFPKALEIIKKLAE